MLAIQKYIKLHGIAKTIKDFDLKTREYDKKILLKYNQLVSPTLMGLPEMQDCRGIILEKDTWKVMSLAFRKFFNSGEGNAAKIDWSTARVLEKLDGTMIQLYWDWNQKTWFAATTGTAEGEGEVNNKMKTTFNKLFWDTVKDKYGLTPESDMLNKKYCYVFELTTPYNIVVKPHGESSATLLTVRNIETLVEQDFANAHANNLGVPVVKTFDLNAKNAGHLIKTFETMPWSEEGYVVLDYDFNRVKIKNPAYVAVHHLKSKTSEHAIMEVVKTNEIEEFAATFPDRRAEITKLKEGYDALIIKLEGVWGELKAFKPKNITKEEQKKFAMKVFEIGKANDVDKFSNMFFGLGRGTVGSVSEFLKEYDNKTLYNTI